jgi:transposase
MLMPVDMREWLPEDDLAFIVLDAVAALDLSEFRHRYRADGRGRAAFDPEMMVALLLYGYCQGKRSSRVTGKRCVRDVGYRVIAGGPYPDHATIARFRARHEKALGGLFSQVLRLLAAEGMVSLGLLSLDGTKLAGNAAQKANRTLPQIEKILAEAAAANAAEDARFGDAADAPTPRALARRAERRERLAAHRARRFRVRQRGELRPRRPGQAAAARAAGQGPGPDRRPPCQKSQAPRPVSGHRPRPAATAASPRTGGLQAAGPHRGTGVRATQDLPETDHDVPARPGRV